ncbi:MAG: methyltransferase [Desulfobulbaceae bacterium]|nr:methyltransferase [Desulfobulbaceae bacterium]
MSEPLPRQCTSESLFGGRLNCRQHLHGYRFSQDPVLLAHFFKPSPEEHILDLGTGCGIIALILAYRWAEVSIAALEVQPALAGLARGNLEQNGFSGRVRVVEGDLKQVGSLLPAASFDRVVCNPPYRQAGAARPNPDPEQAIARHEIMAGLEDVVKAVDWLLVEGGRADFIYPAERAAELQATLKASGCAPVRLQEIYSYPEGSCRLILLEAVKGGQPGLEILPPFYVQTGPEGGYTREMAGFYEP